MRRITGLLLWLLVGCLALAACSESDDLDASTDEGSEDTDSEDTGSDDTDSEDTGSDDTGSGDGDVADAVALLEGQGLSSELAECAIDSLLDQGYETSDLSQIAFPDEELIDALALAGGECVEFADGLPEGAFDLDDPAVRRGFITSFSASSGLSEEVGECVLDDLIANDVDIDQIVSGTIDDEVATIVQDAVAACS